MNRRRFALLALGAAAVLASGCGIPTDGSPRAIADESNEILGDDTSPPTTSEDPGARRIGLYFVDPDGLLVRVERPVDIAPDAATRVVELLGGVTEVEMLDDLSSAIPRDTQLLESNITDELVTLDLSPQIDTIAGEKLVQAYAQIVYTATDQGSAKNVQFRVDGEPRNVPTDEGDIGVVTNSDYFSLAPDN